MSSSSPRAELMDEVRRHEVGEAQWLATIMMGLDEINRSDDKK